MANKQSTQAIIGDPQWDGLWINDPMHQKFLKNDVRAQLGFFRPMLRSDGGFDVPDFDGAPLPDGPQEIHTTARMVHSFALAKQFGFDGCDDVIDAGMAYLWNQQRDPVHGGYFSSVNRDGTAASDVKLAYGHVFVLLAASTAKDAGHSDADRLLADVTEVLQTRYWEEAHGRFADEFRADWTTFSAYRGLNANMHAVEAHLAAYEATDDTAYLERAGRILSFFFDELAPAYNWRLPEHFDENWKVDADYEGDPMFRPAGSTPGHSMELGRMLLQYWDLKGRSDASMPTKARRVIETAYTDAARPDGGLVYTLRDGKVSVPDRYWWPVTEAIGAFAALQKVDPQPKDEERYRALWAFADSYLIDHEKGGWFPELDDAGQAVSKQFLGKPDIYHAIQAGLFPPVPALSRVSAKAG
ncbi:MULTISPECIES: AGE family epimerase/isomerase [Halocynthiibacter]|uniref:AGE family epimerase/isomerase n=1 Tax=Halocynthiibacter halioticoli TaxID=2986804 RepID=A0AAE3IYF8_9RHOB|nr:MULTISPECIES: AGE family epimerase/isomerase [Halocynthiibacter]MCV6824557.1 AGE family epimerase/isomerase [Halocynthiibacter halioticoli]MCW4057558.1 AGE family epimerase/isomerase [Halocynthiibacter sp. SDUM655004]